jgi:hypothetical protein
MQGCDGGRHFIVAVAPQRGAGEALTQLQLCIILLLRWQRRVQPCSLPCSVAGLCLCYCTRCSRVCCSCAYPEIYNVLLLLLLQTYTYAIRAIREMPEEAAGGSTALST